jgi:hypothetical protein
MDPAAESMARQVEIAELSVYIDCLKERIKDASARLDQLQTEEQEYFDRARAEAELEDLLDVAARERARA